MADLDLPALRRKAEAAERHDWPDLLMSATTVLALITSAERLAEAGRLLRTVPMLTYTDNERIWKNEVRAFLANASPPQDEVGEIVKWLRAQGEQADMTRGYDDSGGIFREAADAIERGDWREEKPDDA